MDIHRHLQELTDTGGFTSILKELKIVTVYIILVTLYAFRHLAIYIELHALLPFRLDKP